MEASLHIDLEEGLFGNEYVGRRAAVLLNHIRNEGQRAADLLFDNMDNYVVVGRVYPRKWAASGLRGIVDGIFGHALMLHRLDLHHPLYLGEDGAVYREYFGKMGCYFQRAEIELRDEAGLERILSAILKLMRLAC